MKEEPLTCKETKALKCRYIYSKEMKAVDKIAQKVRRLFKKMIILRIPSYLGMKAQFEVDTETANKLKILTSR